MRRRSPTPTNARTAPVRRTEAGSGTCAVGGVTVVVVYVSPLIWPVTVAVATVEPLTTKVDGLFTDRPKEPEPVAVVYEIV